MNFSQKISATFLTFILFLGLTPEKARVAAIKLGFPPENQDEIADIFVKLYQIFVEKDATMVEINPFAEDSNGSCKNLTLTQVFVFR